MQQGLLDDGMSCSDIRAVVAGAGAGHSQIPSTCTQLGTAHTAFIVAAFSPCLSTASSAGSPESSVSCSQQSPRSMAPIWSPQQHCSSSSSMPGRRSCSPATPSHSCSTIPSPTRLKPIAPVLAGTAAPAVTSNSPQDTARGPRQATHQQQDSPQGCSGRACVRSCTLLGQMPPSVAAVLAMQSSPSRQQFRERQRAEAYALNAVLAM